MPTPAPNTVLNEGPGIWSVLLMILYLVIILVGVYYATRLFARIAQRGMGRQGKKSRTKHIYLVDRMMLDKDKSLALVEKDGKRYFLGVTQQNITLLQEEDAPEPSPEDEAVARPTGSVTFQDILKSWKDRSKA